MSISFITGRLQRIDSTPLWGRRPPAPSLDIAALVHETSETGPVSRTESEMTYPGEGFEGVVLPECMAGRVKRTKTVLTWTVTENRTLALKGVAWSEMTIVFAGESQINLPDHIPPVILYDSGFHNSAGETVATPVFSVEEGQGAFRHPQPVHGTLVVQRIARPETVIAQGVRLGNWTSVNYSPTWLVPPLNEAGEIPDCGGYFDNYGWTSESVSYVQDNRPDPATVEAAPWETEARRVRDNFPWHHYQVGVDPQGAYLVRALPLANTTLENWVFPHDPGQRHTGNCQADPHHFWVSPAPEPVVDTPWQQEVQGWAATVDWSGVARAVAAPATGMTVRVAAVAAGAPAWQVTLSFDGQPQRLFYPNQAESRLVSVTVNEAGETLETRVLLRLSYHPESKSYTETPILTGYRRRSADLNLLRPAYLVEAYETVY